MSWEKRLDERLKGLPQRRAPGTLSARVLAAAALRAKPWHARPWWSWSAPARAGFAAAVGVGALAVGLLARGPLSTIAGGLDGLAGRLDWALVLGSALGRALWSLRGPLGLAALFFGTMAVLPAAAIAALSRGRSR